MPRSFLPVFLPEAANLATEPVGRRFGGLAAGVGIDLGVEDEDVDVPVHGHDVVEPAVADVIGPAVAADAPDALLDEVSPAADRSCQSRLGAVGLGQGRRKGADDGLGRRLGLVVRRSSKRISSSAGRR